MLCGLVIVGIAIIIAMISTGTEASSKLYYDLVEDAGDLRGGAKPTVIEVKDQSKKFQPKVKKTVEPVMDDADTLAQSIYDSTEM